MTAGIKAAGAVRELAAGQWGLFTAAQARGEGLTPQQLAGLANAGVLERLRHGVYRIAGTPSVPAEELRGAWLALEPRWLAHERLARPGVEVVSHRSAAVLLGLGDLEADRLEFTVSSRKQTRDPQIRLHRRQLKAGEWTLADGLPVTTVLVTVQDLAAARVDGGHLAGVVRDAITSGRADIEEVADALDPYAHQYGAPLGHGRELLEQWLHQVGVPESTRALGRLLDPDAVSRSSLQSTLAAVAALTSEPMQRALAAASEPGLEVLRQALGRTVGQSDAMRETLATASALQSEPVKQALASLSAPNLAPLLRHMRDAQQHAAAAGLVDEDRATDQRDANE